MSDISKKHYVAWSGGLDSTLLLYDLCVKAKETGDEVYALCSEPWFLQEKKSISENKARAKIRKEFIARELNFSITTVKIDVEWNCYTENPIGITQPMLWVTQFFPLLPSDAIIHFGYIRSDDFWHYKDGYMKMIKGINEMLTKNIEVVFDLEFATKTDVIKRIKQLQLDELVWFCEIPEKVGEPCGQCEPCKKYLESSVAIEIENFQDFTKLKDIMQEFVLQKEVKDKSVVIEKLEVEKGEEKVLDNNE